MSKEKNNIDELFRDKLRDFSVETPEHVWKGIEASRTPLHRAINFFKGKKGASIASIVLLATVGSIAYVTSINNTAKQSAVISALQQYNNSGTIQAAKLNSNQVISVTSNNGSTSGLNEHVNTSSLLVKEDLATNKSITEESSTPIIKNTATTNLIYSSATTPSSTATKNATTTILETNENSTKVTVELSDKEDKLNNNTLNTINKAAEVVISKTEETNNSTKNNIANNIEAVAPENSGVKKADKSSGQSGQAIEPPKNFSKVTVDLYAGGNYTMRSLSGNGIDQNYLEAKRDAETYSPGFVIGTRINYDVKNLFTLRVGAQYSRFNQNLNLEREYQYTTTKTVTGVILDPVTQQPIGTTTRTDTITNTEIARANATNTISFLDIPVQVEINIYKTRKYSVFATAGAAANLRFTQTGHQINKRLTGVDEITTANSPFRTTAGISALAGIGLNYSLTNRFSILVEGTYQHGISDVMKASSGMNQSFRIINTSVGLRYRF